MQKGDLSISEYIQHIKNISNALMVVGAPVSDNDLIAVILNSLSDAYESFIDSIMLRISSTSLDELHGLLLNKDMFMNRKKEALISSATEPFQAFATQYQTSQPPLLPTPQAYATWSTNYNSGHYRGNNRGKGNFSW